MKKINIRIKGTIEVPDEATTDDIQEAVEFAVGLNGTMKADNPIGYDLDWTDGEVEIV